LTALVNEFEEKALKEIVDSPVYAKGNVLICMEYISCVTQINEEARY